MRSLARRYVKGFMLNLRDPKLYFFFFSSANKTFIKLERVTSRRNTESKNAYEFRQKERNGEKLKKRTSNRELDGATPQLHIITTSLF